MQGSRRSCGHPNSSCPSPGGTKDLRLLPGGLLHAYRAQGCEVALPHPGRGGQGWAVGTNDKSACPLLGAPALWPPHLPRMSSLQLPDLGFSCLRVGHGGTGGHGGGPEGPTGGASGGARCLHPTWLALPCPPLHLEALCELGNLILHHFTRHGMDRLLPFCLHLGAHCCCQPGGNRLNDAWHRSYDAWHMQLWRMMCST